MPNNVLREPLQNGHILYQTPVLARSTRLVAFVGHLIALSRRRLPCTELGTVARLSADMRTNSRSHSRCETKRTRERCGLVASATSKASATCFITESPSSATAIVPYRPASAPPYWPSSGSIEPELSHGLLHRERSMLSPCSLRHEACSALRLRGISS